MQLNRAFLPPAKGPPQAAIGSGQGADSVMLCSCDKLDPTCGDAIRRTLHIHVNGETPQTARGLMQCMRLWRIFI